MSDHLISCSRFLDALVLDADNKTDLIQVHQALEKAVISPDEVRGVGEWLTEYEPNGRPYQFHCSVCDSDFSQMGITHASNYCPNCGARIKGKEVEQ